MSKGLTIKETAQLLGITIPTVWYRIKRKILKSAYMADCGHCFLIERKEVMQALKEKDRKTMENLEKRNLILNKETLK